MSNRIRVFLIEPQTLTRRGLRLLLENTGRVEVAGDTGCFQEASVQLRALDPVVLLVEPGMGWEGAEQVYALMREFRSCPLVILSACCNERVALEILARGGAGILLKTLECEELIRALMEIRGGGLYIDPRISLALIQFAGKASEPPAPHHEGLTARERAVLSLASQGLNTSQITAHLDLSSSTVKTHLRSIYAKLGVSDRTQAVLAGIRSGIVESPRKTVGQVPDITPPTER